MPDITLKLQDAAGTQHYRNLPVGHYFHSDHSDLDGANNAKADSAALLNALKNLDDKLHNKGPNSISTGLSADQNFLQKAGPAVWGSKALGYAAEFTRVYNGEKAQVIDLKIDSQHEYVMQVTPQNIKLLTQALKDAASDDKNGVAAFAKIKGGELVKDSQVLSGLEKVFDAELAKFKIKASLKNDILGL